MRSSLAHERGPLQSIGLDFPNLPSHPRNLRAKLVKECVHIRDVGADVSTDLSPPLLIGLERRGPPVLLPLLHCSNGLRLLALHILGDHVERGSHRVTASWLEELDGRDLGECVQQEDAVPGLEPVEEDHHCASGPQIVQAEGQLREQQPAGFPTFAVGGPVWLVGPEDLAVAQDKVEHLASAELCGTEVLGMGVLERDFIVRHAHVRGKHGDVEELDVDPRTPLHRERVATMMVGQGEAESTGSAVDLESVLEEEAGRRTLVKDCGCLCGRGLDGEATSLSLHLFGDPLHHLVHVSGSHLSTLVGLVASVLEESIGIFTLPTLFPNFTQASKASVILREVCRDFLLVPLVCVFRCGGVLLQRGIICCGVCCGGLLSFLVELQLDKSFCDRFHGTEDPSTPRRGMDCGMNEAIEPESPMGR